MPNRNPETLEDARALLLENDTEIANLRSQVETLTATIGERESMIEDLRTLNQKYYLRLAQGEDKPESPTETPKPAPLKEWAQTLKGVVIK